MAEEEKTYSFQVVKMLWRVINAAFAGDEGKDSLSFNEKELLEDVLRYDSLAKVAKLRHVSPSTINNHFQTAMEKIEKRLLSLEDTSLTLSVAQKEYEKAYKKLEQDLIERIEIAKAKAKIPPELPKLRQTVASKDLIIERNEQVIKQQKTEIRHLQAQIDKEKEGVLENKINALNAKLKIANNEAAELRREMLIAKNEITRLKRLVPAPSIIAPAKAPEPKYLSDYQSKLLCSGIEVLRLRNNIVESLNEKGIETVFDLVRIPRHKLSQYILQGWRKPINESLNRHNLSLTMSVTYHPDINKFEKED